MELRGFTLYVVSDLDGSECVVGDGEVYVADTGDVQRNRAIAEREIERYQETFTYKSGSSG